MKHNDNCLGSWGYSVKCNCETPEDLKKELMEELEAEEKTEAE